MMEQELEGPGVRVTNEQRRSGKLGRRDRLNDLVHRFIQPKSGLTVLNELGYRLIWKSSEKRMTSVLKIQKSGNVEEFEFTGSTLEESKEGVIDLAVSSVMKKLLTVEEEDMGQREIDNLEVVRTPWAFMASYSMYVKMREWQKHDGIWKELENIPAPPTPRIEDGKVRILPLPPNFEKKNPLCVVNEITAGEISFDEVGIQEGNFLVEFKFNGRCFQGEGHSKKLAKHECAIKVIKAVIQEQSSDYPKPE